MLEKVLHANKAQNYEVVEGGMLAEDSVDRIEVYVPSSGTIKARYEIFPEGEAVPGETIPPHSVPSEGVWEGEEIAEDKIVQLLKDGEITAETPLRYTETRDARYVPGQKVAELEPKDYDPEKDEFAEEGERVPELDRFAENFKGRDEHRAVSEFLSYLYEDLGIRHSTDVPEGVSSGDLDDNQADNMIEALNRGFGICGELERMFSYTMRNMGIPADRPSRAIAVRYREEDGITVPDPEGPEIIGHTFSKVELGGEEVIVDPSIYMHLREKGVDHGEAAFRSIGNNEVYYSNSVIYSPSGFNADLEEISFEPAEK